MKGILHGGRWNGKVRAAKRVRLSFLPVALAKGNGSHKAPVAQDLGTPAWCDVIEMSVFRGRTPAGCSSLALVELNDAGT